jgi:hypothetical protein
VTVGVLKGVITSARSQLLLNAVYFEKWFPSPIVDVENILLTGIDNEDLVWSLYGSRTRPVSPFVPLPLTHHFGALLGRWIVLLSHGCLTTSAMSGYTPFSTSQETDGMFA